MTVQLQITQGDGQVRRIPINENIALKPQVNGRYQLSGDGKIKKTSTNNDSYKVQMNERYQLIKDEQIKKVPTSKDTLDTLNYEVKLGERYQLVDEFGKPIKDVETISDGKYIRFYHPHYSNPAAVLENNTGIVPEAYYDNSSGSNQNAALATEVTPSSASALSLWEWLGAGLLATGGGLFAANYNASKSSYQSTTALPTPTVTFDSITNDNVINAQEAESEVEITGIVKDLQENDRLQLTVGGETYEAKVEDEQFVAQVNGQTLAANQKVEAEIVRNNAVIKADVTTKDESGNLVTTIGGAASYAVDVDLPSPGLSWQPIGNNGTINSEIAASSIKLRGEVTNLNEDESVQINLKIGENTVTANKVDNYYEADIPSEYFAQANTVEWQLLAQDKAGNENLITLQQAYFYDVSLENPTITIDSNVVISSDAKTVQISGTLDYESDVDQNSISLDILHHKQHYSATVEGKTWKVELPLIEGKQPITLTAKVQDLAGNQAEKQLNAHIKIIESPPASSDDLLEETVLTYGSGVATTSVTKKYAASSVVSDESSDSKEAAPLAFMEIDKHLTLDANWSVLG